MSNWPGHWTPTLLSYSDLKQASWFTRALARWVGEPVALAWLAFRRRGTFYFGNAENTALPLALLLKMRPAATVAFIGHRLTTPMKTRLIRVFNLLRHVDVVFVYSALQARHLIDRLGFPADRVRQIPFQVDEPVLHALGRADGGTWGRERRP